MSGGAHCSLTRAIAFHATHQFPEGGPADRHGHLYRIEVTVRAVIDSSRRMVMDLDTLDTILTREITHPLAGRHLNAAIPEFASSAQLPSCEALAAWCWRMIAPHLPAGAALERVRVAEDATLWADCTGTT